MPASSPLRSLLLLLPACSLLWLTSGCSSKPAAAPAAEAPLGEGDVVTIVGRKENIALAKKKIEERVTQLENTIEDSIKVEQKYLKEMMANRGQFLKELLERRPVKKRQAAE